MSNEAKLNNGNNETDVIQHQDDPYLKAREVELQGRMQPSKVSDWPLVSFVEVNGVAYPVYRKDS